MILPSTRQAFHLIHAGVRLSDADAADSGHKPDFDDFAGAYSRRHAAGLLYGAGFGAYNLKVEGHGAGDGDDNAHGNFFAPGIFVAARRRLFTRDIDMFFIRRHQPI